MNILIPHRWLLDHLETKATPSQISTQLSLAGPSVERVEEKLGDQIYDIEITTNRVDSMSIRGIAQEAAVILDYAGIPAKLKPLNLPKLKQLKPKTQKYLPLPKIINRTKAINRIMAVVLTNIDLTPTPNQMAQRLAQIDQNIHWAAIDITNYVTHELGHPCHAFDYDKIMNLGGQIIIDEAKKGENFTTLDGETYQTVGGEIVFRSLKGEIIDLPAIKGTANTAVDKNTKNILFWIENMDAKKVRFASMTHDIRTVAAQLNEKHVDPYLAEPTLAFGIKLYQEVIGAQVASEIYDLFIHQRTPQPIKTSLAVFERYLGLKLPRKTITKILTQLGCKLELKKQQLVVTPPTYRHDLTISVDLVEEVARIYGYHNLPGKIMTGALPLKRPKNDTFNLEEKIKNFLSVLGLYEVYTYSLISRELALASSYKLNEHLKLANPLTDDKVYLRRSLLPSLNQVIQQNPTHLDLKVFELAKVYHPQGEGTDRPKEVMKLGLSLRTDYRHGRGIIEALLDHLFIYNYQFQVNQSDQTALIVVKRKNKYHHLGVIKLIKSLSQQKTQSTKQNQPSYLVNAELDLNALAKVAGKHPRYTPIINTAKVKEELTFIIPPNVQVGQVMNAIRQVSPQIKSVNLKDIYQDRYTFTLIYQDRTKNLRDDEIAPIRKAIVNQLSQTYRVKLVGNL